MAGVSTTAVSFVLNDRPGVSDATRKKVQEIIRQTDFIPNVHTRRLNLGKSFTVNVVLKQYAYDLFNQFALETLSGVFKEGKSLGYSIIFTLVDEHANGEKIIDSVRSKDCDGVILNQISDDRLISQLQRENIPFVCVDAHLPADSELPMVEVDYYDAAFQATRYLHQHGHTKIGFVGPVTPAGYYAKTYRGFEDYMKSAGLPVTAQWVSRIELAEGAAESVIHGLMKYDQRPSAILCVGDALAIDMIRGAKASGIRIPEDISVMSLDDLLVSRYLDPPLSTMTFDKELLGTQAMRLLYQIIQGAEHETHNMIATTPVERESVKTIG